MVEAIREAAKLGQKLKEVNKTLKSQLASRQSQFNLTFLLQFFLHSQKGWRSSMVGAQLDGLHLYAFGKEGTSSSTPEDGR